MSEIHKITTMSDDEMKETEKKLNKLFVRKIVLGVVAAVAIHFASEYIISKIESKNQEETPEEN